MPVLVFLEKRNLQNVSRYLANQIVCSIKLVIPDTIVKKYLFYKIHVLRQFLCTGTRKV